MESGDEAVEAFEVYYSQSIPPFDRFSEAMQQALSKTLEEVNGKLGKEETTRLRVKAMHNFLLALKGDRSAYLQSVKQAMSSCRKCPELSGPPVLSMGAPGALIMLVGEAPGEEEQKQGKPFIGRAGKLLSDMVKSAGIPQSLIYIANTCRCRPPGNRVPKKGEVKNCFPWLVAEIDCVSPMVIVPLGTTAAKVFLGPKAGTMKDIHGRMFVIGAQVIMPTYHPAAVLRSAKGAEEGLKDDLKKLSKLTDILRV